MTHDLAKTILQIRLKSGDSPAEAARKIGCSRQGYVKWEGGDTKNMKLGNLLAFCDAYKIPVEDLIRGAFVVEPMTIEEDQAKKNMHLNAPPDEKKQGIDSNAMLLIDGFRKADDGFRQAMLVLAREAISVFDQNLKNK